MGQYMFAHGDKKIVGIEPAVSLVVMGHEHPSIGIRTRMGSIERFRCFLYGNLFAGRKQIRLLVLPASGYFETEAM